MSLSKTVRSALFLVVLPATSTAHAPTLSPPSRTPLITSHTDL